MPAVSITHITALRSDVADLQARMTKLELQGRPQIRDFAEMVYERLDRLSERVTGLEAAAMPPEDEIDLEALLTSPPDTPSAEDTEDAVDAAVDITVYMRSERFCYEEFPRGTIEEALESIRAMWESALSLNDGVERDIGLRVNAQPRDS